MTEAWTKRLLLAAAAWNILGGASALWDPAQHVAQLYTASLSLDDPLQLLFYRCTWINVIAWGVAWLARTWHGSGAALEAAEAVIGFGFRTLNADCVYAETLADNKAALSSEGRWACASNPSGQAKPSSGIVGRPPSCCRCRRPVGGKTRVAQQAA